MLRRALAKALRAIGSSTAVPYLLQVLDDSEPYVVMYAAQVLGTIGDRRAVEPLVGLFDREDAVEGPLAANPAFTNIATAAHYALVAIAKTHLSIRSEEELEIVRALWRIKLGLQKNE